MWWPSAAQAAPRHLRRAQTQEEIHAKNAMRDANEALSQATDARDPEAACEARERLAQAQADYFQAVRKEETADALAFRDALYRLDLVRQVFDPWLMEPETRDGLAPTLNRLETDNEKLHATHLHVTVHDALLGYERPTPLQQAQARAHRKGGVRR